MGLHLGPHERHRPDAVGSIGLGDEPHFLAIDEGQLHEFAGLLGQGSHERQAKVVDAQPVDVPQHQGYELEGDAKAVGEGIARHIPFCLQGGQDAGDGALGEAQLKGQLTHRKAVGQTHQSLINGHAALYIGDARQAYSGISHGAALTGHGAIIATLFQPTTVFPTAIPPGPERSHA